MLFERPRKLKGALSRKLGSKSLHLKTSKLPSPKSLKPNLERHAFTRESKSASFLTKSVLNCQINLLHQFLRWSTCAVQHSNITCHFDRCSVNYYNPTLHAWSNTYIWVPRVYRSSLQMLNDIVNILMQKTFTRGLAQLHLWFSGIQTDTVWSVIRFYIGWNVAQHTHTHRYTPIAKSLRLIRELDRLKELQCSTVE